MRLPLVEIVLCSLAFALAPSFAAADDRQAAQEAFQRGNVAFEAEDYAAALDAFLASYELYPHDQIRFNLARCYKFLGRLPEAIGEFEAVVESADVADEVRVRAGQAAAELRLALARLEITADAGATVTVDDVPVCEGSCIHYVEASGNYRVGARGGSVREVSGVIGGSVRVDVRAPERQSPPPPASAPGLSVGPFGIVGASLAGIGLAGAIGFGVWALDLHADFEEQGCAVVDCDLGNLTRDLTNVSIGVLSLGGALFLLDLFLIE